MNKNVKLYDSLSSEGATIAKIIATVCVVFTHAYKIFDYMGIDDSDVFYLRGFHAFGACGVPVFFLLSGYYLVFKGDWNWFMNLKKKTKTLLVPYCLFILCYALISCIGFFLAPMFFDDFRTFKVNDWVIHLLGIPFVEGPHFYGALWFVRDLYILNIASFFIVPVVKKIPNYFVVIIMLFMYFLPLPQYFRYPITFFIIGISFGLHKKLPVIHFSYLLLFLFLIAFFVNILIEGNFPWMISVLLMTIVVISVSERITKKIGNVVLPYKLISFSFPIYLLHNYPITIIMRLLASVNVSLQIAIISFFVTPWITILLCIAIIIPWRTCFPNIYIAFFGGRGLFISNNKNN